MIMQWDFLQEKYPSHTFKFTFCNPKGNVNPFSYFIFKADNKDDLFNLYLYIDDNHTYSCKDNYYGELLKDSYNAAFLNFLQEYFPECIGVSCYFTNIMGEECDETLTGKEVLDGKLKISNTSYIYAVQPDNSSADILADNIETFIKDNKIYGCYYVNILNSAPDQSYSGDSLRKYIREKNEMVIAQREVNMEKAEH